MESQKSSAVANSAPSSLMQSPPGERMVWTQAQLSPKISQLLTALPEVAQDGCPAIELPAAQYQSPTLARDADVFFVQAEQEQFVCIVDSLGRLSTQTIGQNIDAPIYGKPPFIVLSSGLKSLSIFYHGALIPKEKLLGKTLVIESREEIQEKSFSISAWVLKLMKSLL